MATRKKHKVHFEVPEDVQAPAKSGWVYRTENGPGAPPVEAAAATPETSVDQPSAPVESIPELAVKTATHSLAAMNCAFLLSTRVAMLPVSVARRIITPNS